MIRHITLTEEDRLRGLELMNLAARKGFPQNSRSTWGQDIWEVTVGPYHMVHSQDAWHDDLDFLKKIVIHYYVASKYPLRGVINSSAWTGRV